MKQQEKRAVIIKDDDNVAVAVVSLKKGETVSLHHGSEVMRILLVDDIAFLHKFALKDIAAGDEIIKYGQVIGAASTAIKAGAHVHTHNIKSLRGNFAAG